MKAAVIRQYQAPLELTEVPISEPGVGEVLVRVRACGVCHTDLHAINGDWPDKPSLPRIPGHEAVGEVVEVGDNVTEVQVGDRVGVPWLHGACGQCEQCLSGWETLCRRQVRSGYDVDGGFAEYLVAEAPYVIKLPNALEWVQAAPLMCAGLTVYKGLIMTAAAAGQWVVVSGIGGLGHLAVQYARAMGLRVIATDVDEAKLDLAAKLGAELTLNVRNVDPVGYVQRQIGGAHAALVTAVSRGAFVQTIDMMRPGATVVLNGLPPGDFPLNIYDMVMRALTLRGSIVGTRYDNLRALELAASAGIRATVHLANLDDVNAVLESLHKAALPGRSVLEI